MSDPVKQDSILDQFSMITRPYTRPDGLKTIRFPAAHTRIANIWEYYPGPGGGDDNTANSQQVGNQPLAVADENLLKLVFPALTSQSLPSSLPHASSILQPLWRGSATQIKDFSYPMHKTFFSRCTCATSLYFIGTPRK